MDVFLPNFVARAAAFLLAALPAVALAVADPPAVSASRLLGTEVVGPEGRDLGDITDLAVDVNGEEVLYAMVFANGDTVTLPQGETGLGTSVFAVAFRALRPSIEAEKLVALPEQNRPPEAPAPAGARMLRASTLIGMDVVTPEGRRLGDIVDFIVALETGRVLHAVFRSDAPRSARLDIPLSAFHFPPTAGHAVLDAPAR